MGLEVEVIGETNKFDVIVIGGGIAGMTASSLVTKSGLKSCFLEKDVPGGKLMRIDELHNFSQPGVTGKDLALSVFHQATEEIKTTYAYGYVRQILPKNGLFYLYTDDGQTWEAKAIILAIGTQIKKLNVPGEEQYTNHGVSYCVHCDAALTKNKKVIMVGSDEHKHTLEQFTNQIQIIKPEDIQEITGDGSKVTGLVTKDGHRNPCDFIFIDVGFILPLDFVPQDFTLAEGEYIFVDANMKSPYAEGVFACGDCIVSDVKMVQPALQQAAIAAKSAVEYVKSKKW